MGSPSERVRCGLSALLPTECRGRAEAFARRLQSKLTSLGADGKAAAAAAAATEASWLGARAAPRKAPPPIALTQPRLSDGDQYLDFGLLESPPTECDEPDFYKVVNQDSLKGCHYNNAKEENKRFTNGVKHYPSNDSDSDVYYDTEDLLEERLHNGSQTLEPTRSLDNLSSTSSTSSTQEFATTTDYPPSLADDPPSLNGYDVTPTAMPPFLNEYPPSLADDPPSLTGYDVTPTARPPFLTEYPPPLNSYDVTASARPPSLTDDPPSLNGHDVTPVIRPPRLTDDPPCLIDDPPSLNGHDVTPVIRPPRLTDDPPCLIDDPPSLNGHDVTPTVRPPSLTDDPPSLNGHDVTPSVRPLSLTDDPPSSNGYDVTPSIRPLSLTDDPSSLNSYDATASDRSPCSTSYSNGYVEKDFCETNGCTETHHVEDCGTGKGHNDTLSNGDIEIDVSNLNIDKDLTVECPAKTTPQQNGTVENGIVEREELNLELKKEDEDENEERPPRVRRCSSLKTGKTPPGTPGRKKIVRFADVLGLDLAAVRTFLDEVPRVPTSAYVDLKGVDLGDEAAPREADGFAGACAAAAGAAAAPPAQYHGARPDKILVPLFQQPGGMPNFLDVVRENQVCMENAAVVDQVLFTIHGMVRVRNLDFHKSVHVRYTLDGWRSFADVRATYVEGSCDGFSDKFVFTVYAHTLCVGQKIEFACRFSCRGCQYWDNNKGANYCFQCLPQSSSPSYTPIVTGRGLDDHWGADFYYNGQEEPGEPSVVVGEQFLSTAVQDYITASMDVKRAAGEYKKGTKKKQDILTVFVIVIFSFLFMYLQKVIYSATVK